MPADERQQLDRVRFLARAESRVRILEHLLEAGPITQRSLRSELDASRTTVARSLASLEGKGWVTTDEGAYDLTRAGRAVTVEFTRLLETMARLDEVGAVLRWLPPDLDVPEFWDATDLSVTTPTDGDPYAPTRAQSEILHSADRLRLLLPAIGRDSTAAIVEEVTERGLEVETVVTPDLEATMESEAFAAQIREMGATGRSTIYVSPDPVPCYLGLADDGRVQVGVADDDGLPRALLETPDEAVREWAEALYGEYRSGARHKPAKAF